MRVSEPDRRSLARARAHYRRAAEELPAGAAYNHMRALTRSFISSIDDSIGDDPADNPIVRDADGGPCLGLHTEGCRCEPNPKLDPMPDEKAMAHAPGWPTDCGTVDAAEFGGRAS